MPVEKWLAADERAAGVAGLVSEAFGALPDQPTRDDHVAALRSLAGTIEGRDRLDRTAARHEAAERLKASGLTPGEARDLARAALEGSKGSGSSQRVQGTTLELEDPETWVDRVEGAPLAEKMTAALLRYVVLPPEAVWAVVLWIFFTYLLDVVPVAPRLLVTSPTKACGKTRVLVLMWALARRPLPSSSVTAAALYRVIETHAPTLLVDELDNMGLSEKPDLLAVINSGHPPGTASVLRAVGEEHEVRLFSTWCALAMAGIRVNSLPDTALSRAIRIPLIRKRKADKVARLREGHLKTELEPLRRQLMRWSVDHA
jgi:putative DNA primase/helicase